MFSIQFPCIPITNKNRKTVQETLYNYYSYLDRDIKIDKINFFDFEPEQLLSINEALKHNLDIKWINNPVLLKSRRVFHRY